MLMVPPPSLVNRYALISHCQDARLLHKADALIAADQQAQTMLAQPGARVASDVQTRVREGTLRLKQVMWTVQVPLRTEPGLEVRTLCLAPDSAVWFNLAEDAALDFGGALSQPGTRVLRYIPGRRATVIMADARIRKFKKNQRLASAISRHRKVEDATRGQEIHIPRLLSEGPDYSLSLCPGRTMEAGLATADRLRALGEIVARLHGCVAVDVPMADLPEDPLPWLQAAIPGLSPRLSRLGSVLPSCEGQAQVLCHGDLSLAQVLVDCQDSVDRLTLLDFDRAGMGSAAGDLATLLCGLQDAGTDPAIDAEAHVIAGYSSHADLPVGLGPARCMAGLERLRHLIRKGTAPTRVIMAGLARAEAAVNP